MRWIAFLTELRKGTGLKQRKKILVLGSEKLLTAAILSLLESRSELEVANMTVNSLRFLDQPDCPEPDVIILDEDLVEANLSDLVRLIERHPTLRLIVFGLSDSKVQVFDKQLVEVRQVGDFLELL